MSATIPDDRGCLRFPVFISRESLGRLGNSKIPDRLGFSRQLKTRLKCKPCINHFKIINCFSKSHGSSKSATFGEWLEEKKSKKQKQQQKEREEKKRKETEGKNRRIARMGGHKSFEEWKNSKAKQKQDLPNMERRRDDIIREEPGRRYSISFESWINRTGALDLY